MPDTQAESSSSPAARKEADEHRFASHYGSWALIAGASEGLGEAFARALSDKGVNLVLVARRKGPLDALAEELRTGSKVEVRCLDGDLASGSFLERLWTECNSLDLGVVVCNAAQAPIGDFFTREVGDLNRVVDVNVRAPLLLLRGLLPGMVTRGWGAVILMTSFTGHLGTPRIAAYAASKAFLRVLGESLWHELKDKGVDVLACSCGAVRTPGYMSAADNDPPGTLEPEQVVKQALRALGTGPVVMPGFINRLATCMVTRLLPKRAAIVLLAGSTKRLARVKDTRSVQ